MTVIKRSRVVLTPGAEMPYKVVIERADGSCSEQPIATVREGEELIRASGSPQFAATEIEEERECPLLHGC